jgi:antitoxin component YwqK of YwqJK toxin-antitoxin module
MDIRRLSSHTLILGSLLSALALSSLFAKPGPPADGAVFDPKHEVWVLNANGFQTVWYRDQTRKSEGALSSGKREGAWKFYYPNGKLKGEGAFRENRKVGPWRYLYETGKIKASGSYLDGKMDGKWEFYYPSGRRELEGSFLRGEKSGGWTNYYENGEVFFSGDYRKGLSNGPWVYYFENGKLYQSGEYRDDLRIGTWTICVTPDAACEKHSFSVGGKAPTQSGISESAAPPSGGDPRSILDSLEGGDAPDGARSDIDRKWE